MASERVSEKQKAKKTTYHVHTAEEGEEEEEGRLSMGLLNRGSLFEREN